MSNTDYIFRRSRSEGRAGNPTIEFLGRLTVEMSHRERLDQVQFLKG
jgi:hypothetical protein